MRTQELSSREFGTRWLSGEAQVGSCKAAEFDPLAHKWCKDHGGDDGRKEPTETSKCVVLYRLSLDNAIQYFRILLVTKPGGNQKQMDRFKKQLAQFEKVKELSSKGKEVLRESAGSGSSSKAKEVEGEEAEGKEVEGEEAEGGLKPLQRP